MQDGTITAEAASGSGQAAADAPAGLLFNPDVADWLPDWAGPAWHFLAAWPIVLLPVLVIIAYLAGRGVQAFSRRGSSRSPAVHRAASMTS